MAFWSIFSVKAGDQDLKKLAEARRRHPNFYRVPSKTLEEILIELNTMSMEPTKKSDDWLNYYPFFRGSEEDQFTSERQERKKFYEKYLPPGELYALMLFEKLRPLISDNVEDNWKLQKEISAKTKEKQVKDTVRESIWVQYYDEITTISCLEEKISITKISRHFNFRTKTIEDEYDGGGCYEGSYAYEEKEKEERDLYFFQIHDTTFPEISSNFLWNCQNAPYNHPNRLFLEWILEVIRPLFNCLKKELIKANKQKAKEERAKKRRHKELLIVASKSFPYELYSK